MYLVKQGGAFQLFHNRKEAEFARGPEGELFIKVQNRPSDELEMVYALASELLTQSGINPLTLLLTVPKLDGTVEEVNAVTVMNRAREFIDAMERVH